MAHTTTTTNSNETARAFRLRTAARDTDPDVHVIRKGVRCDTETRGHKTPRGRSPFKIVVDASEGFVPLWARETTLRWRFRDSSLAILEDPDAAKLAIEELLAEALVAWDDAAPVKFAKKDDAWDFEIIMRNADDCDINGCVLASAFFPDAGRHQLVLYPKMFEQDRQEQVETLIHEIGHVFGLRHFFAQVSEEAWPSEIFGKHHKFSIMNYGADSKLTDYDRLDLKRLYQMAWAGEITRINKTPIKFVNAFHTSGDSPDNVVLVAPAQAVSRVAARRIG